MTALNILIKCNDRFLFFDLILHQVSQVHALLVNFLINAQNTTKWMVPLWREYEVGSIQYTPFPTAVAGRGGGGGGGVSEEETSWRAGPTGEGLRGVRDRERDWCCWAYGAPCDQSHPIPRSSGTLHPHLVLILRQLSWIQIQFPPIFFSFIFPNCPFLIIFFFFFILLQHLLDFPHLNSPSPWRFRTQFRYITSHTTHRPHTIKKRVNTSKNLKLMYL